MKPQYANQITIALKNNISQRSYTETTEPRNEYIKYTIQISDMSSWMSSLACEKKQEAKRPNSL